MQTCSEYGLRFTIVLYFCAEVVEHSCGMASVQMGEFCPNIANGVDTYYVREPLGVCAGICPFNFPAMIPLWVCTLILYSSAFTDLSAC